MSLTRRRILALLAALPGSRVSAQGFAGMGTAAEGFAVPDRTPLAFPADHGAHPRFRIEWWYLTANLEAPDGTPMGLQWTLFRSALSPGGGDLWSSPQLWMAHAAVTTPDRHFSAERLARGGVGQAGVEADPFAAWIDDWRLAARDGGTQALSALDVGAGGENFSYRLALRADGPLILQGDDGYSVKSAEGQASRYYSQPFYSAEGALRLDGEEIPVTGRAWLDREWSSQPLSETQEGWDWISLHLSGGAKLMGFRLRETGGTFYGSGTWIAPDGRAVPLPDGALAMDPLGNAEVQGRQIPVRWRVRLPQEDLDITLEAINPDAWMDVSFAYWEGPVRIEGSHQGVGYLEMTGY
ncbi:lipocalin-like domain-containing protein [Tropicimonas sp. IMCC34011]|uniref:lipocalin-like domain-containing protein n=1 Tax=Tropicimonas sp. IMCC34011 TaxID=2248759 RepID=UPI000E241E8D